jgi:hypothetical protein
MKRNGRLRHPVWLGILLILLSVFFYALHYAIFRDLHHIFLYLIGDIAFVFIEVLLVTLIIHQVLADREKRAMLRKLNMVIGAFFSEVGTPLLKHFGRFDCQADVLADRLRVDANWSHDRFGQMREALRTHEFQIGGRPEDLKALQEFVVAKRSFLLGLLENPNLLEHEEFTELLWAVFHLADELSHRKSVESLPETDRHHLGGDIKRAYSLLVREWLSHLEHLRTAYPYLFSLAVRTNPFDPDASVEVS